MSDIDSITTFEACLVDAQPPSGCTGPLLALWHAGRDDWAAAHAIVQELGDTDAAWVHAYLHRVEGDRGNAAYWYQQGQRPMPGGDLKAEWRAIATELLGR